MPDDLVDRLRDKAYSGRFVDTLSEEAAEEIDRLRAAVTLSQAERHVLCVMLDSLGELRKLPTYDADSRFTIDTMSTVVSQLLARLG